MDALQELIRRMRFRHLQMVLELERCGSVRAAAEALHLTQPAVSKTLAEIEQAFGFALFVRGPRGLKPSAQGQVVVRGASVLLTELGHLLGAAQQAGAKPRETIRLGAPPFVAQALLGSLLARLLEKNDELTVEITEGGVPQLFHAVLQGDLDAALSSYSAAALAAENPAQLRFEKLADEDVVVVGSPSHLLVKRRKVGWADLAGEPWIVPRPESFLHHVVEARFVGEGIAFPPPLIVSNNPATNIGLVARGLGVCAIPASAVKEAERAGLVARIRVQPAIDPISVAFVYRSGALVHPRIAKLHAVLSSMPSS